MYSKLMEFLISINFNTMSIETTKLKTNNEEIYTDNQKHLVD